MTSSLGSRFIRGWLYTRVYTVTLFEQFRILLQFTVLADSQNSAGVEASASVSITVLRDISVPKFAAPIYYATVGEYAAVNSAVTTVTATDNQPSTVGGQSLTFCNN